MAFSNKDIEEAKRRVREMQSRADSFVADSGKQNINSTQKTVEKNHKTNESKKEKAEQNQAPDEAEDDKEASMFIVLMLLLILSHEGADGKLLLALLYLLM